MVLRIILMSGEVPAWPETREKAGQAGRVEPVEREAWKEVRAELEEPVEKLRVINRNLKVWLS